MKCEECKFWDKNLRQPSYRDEVVSKLRYCSFLKSAKAIDIINTEYGDAEITTSANFGCIFFEVND